MKTIRRVTVAALVACLGLGTLALSPGGASTDPIAVAAKKKCKKKRHGHKKKRKCKRRQTPAPTPAPAPAPTAAALSISPPSHNFGQLGGGSATFAFTISNAGGLASGTPAASLSGADTSDFQISGNTCTAALAPAATCSVTVQTVDVVGGLHSAKLNVVATPGGAVTATVTVLYV
jgi:hypothetical protein